jgi:hypothetical protein
MPYQPQNNQPIVQPVDSRDPGLYNQVYNSDRYDIPTRNDHIMNMNTSKTGTTNPPGGLNVNQPAAANLESLPQNKLDQI